MENKKEQLDFTPELPKSFEVDFLNSKKDKIFSAMSEIGGFSFRRSGPSEEDDSIYFEGERGDGTKIKIVIEKGENYKTPFELDEIKQEEIEKDKKA